MSTETVIVDTTKSNPQPTLEEQAREMGIDTSNLDETAQSQTADERPSWLPEKFKTAEDMANAYAELEKKFSSREEGTTEAEPKVDDDSPPKVDEQNTNDEQSDTDKAKEAVEKAGLDFDELSNKYWEKGSLEDGDYETLAEAGIPKNMVDQFIAGQQALVQLERQEAFNVVGGESNYESMVKWAATNLTDKEIAAYDRAVNGSDKDARLMAVKGLAARYNTSVGSEPTRELGGQSRSSLDKYESIAQLQEDMRDKRYGKDHAFTRKVEQKLARSDIF